ncbi:SH2 domain-containing protein [Podarcis lilfordi]|uniref:SH2 domain-containing adapter protein D n=1 Tax=Podarcis lilfordi TaxID=74358 RepID=A0AA35LAY7_9SAUR|nr:SH2 domain-containing protein [Podarcis lilfordi]
MQPSPTELNVHQGTHNCNLRQAGAAAAGLRGGPRAARPARCLPAAAGAGLRRPYAGGAAASSAPAADPDGRRCRSPRRRLIRVEAAQAAQAAETAAASGTGDAQGQREKMMIVEDYADPFDTRQETSCQTGEQERVKSEGYMEPYEAQKLLAEIQKTGSNDALAAQKPLHLYDIPYEAPENCMDPDLQQPPGVQCRYSWLPEDDERPPEEYDQPWEWKKERISRVFAVEIEGIQELPWPPPVGQLDSAANHMDAEGPPTLQSISARCLPADAPPSLQDTSASLQDPEALARPLDVSSKGAVKNQPCTEKRSSACWLSMEHGLAFGERVNPTLPLESQAWYHGTLSRVGAEGLLRLCREASYLVRNSESSHDAFSLSLKSSQGFLHMKLLQTEDHKFVLGQHSPPFDNVPEIIHHYASHKLPIQGAEHMSLLYPVTTQPSSCLAAEQ